MPRGRPKKISQETLNVEVRESKEAQMIDEQMEANMKTEIKTPIELFETDVDRELTNNELTTIVNLVKLLNRHICDAKTSVKICTEIMKHYYETMEFRIYIKKAQIQSKDIVLDKFIFPINIRTAPGNAEYGIRLTQVIYSYKTNEITEHTLCEF